MMATVRAVFWTFALTITTCTASSGGLPRNTIKGYFPQGRKTWEGCMTLPFIEKAIELCNNPCAPDDDTISYLSYDKGHWDLTKQAEPNCAYPAFDKLIHESCYLGDTLESHSRTCLNTRTYAWSSEWMRLVYGFADTEKDDRSNHVYRRILDTQSGTYSERTSDLRVCKPGEDDGMQPIVKCENTVCANPVRT